MAAKVSAGLLLYRRRGGNRGAAGAPGRAVVCEEGGGGWTVPKGEVEGEEDLLGRARIEFLEELGAEPPGGPYLELGLGKAERGKDCLCLGVRGGFRRPGAQQYVPDGMAAAVRENAGVSGGGPGGVV